MAITKPNQPPVADAEPDAVREARKGKKRQITLTVHPETLEGVDAFARRIGMSRAAIFNLAAKQLLESGLTIAK